VSAVLWMQNRQQQGGRHVSMTRTKRFWRIYNWMLTKGVSSDFIKKVLQRHITWICWMFVSRVSWMHLFTFWRYRLATLVSWHLFVLENLESQSVRQKNLPCFGSWKTKFGSKFRAQCYWRFSCSIFHHNYRNLHHAEEKVCEVWVLKTKIYILIGILFTNSP
jgi:hypothetical protein